MKKVVSIISLLLVCFTLKADVLLNETFPSSSLPAGWTNTALQDEDYSITIYNSVGQSVYTASEIMEKNEQKKVLDLSLLTEGIYLVNVRVGNSVEENKKLIIQR